MKFYTALAAVAVAAFSATSASAAEYVFQWDYSAPLTLTGITFKDGIEIQNVIVGAEYTSTYGLWDGQTLVNSFAAGFNIEDSDGNLIHTYDLSGTAGSQDFSIPFLSSEVGPLTSLMGGTTVVADGSFQTVYAFSTADDNYTLQFRTNLNGGVVPEPATWGLMIAGFGMVGAALRRSKALAAA